MGGVGVRCAGNGGHNGRSDPVSAKRQGSKYILPMELLLSSKLPVISLLFSLVLHPNKLQVHVVMYDPMNKEAFLEKLRYYLDHPDEARRIGLQGHAYAVRHHRTANRADYMLSVAQFHKDSLWKRSGPVEEIETTIDKQEQTRRRARRRLLMELSQAEAADQFSRSEASIRRHASKSTTI